MAKRDRYPKLFSPGKIGILEIKNRLIMSPMGTRLANEAGAVTQRQINYYVERAKGGVGTIIVECTAVDYPQGTGSRKNLAIHDNAYIGGHGDLVEAVHAHGARIISQIIMWAGMPGRLITGACSPSLLPISPAGSLM